MNDKGNDEVEKVGTSQRFSEGLTVVDGGLFHYALLVDVYDCMGASHYFPKDADGDDQVAKVVAAADAAAELGDLVVGTFIDVRGVGILVRKKGAPASRGLKGGA